MTNDYNDFIHRTMEQLWSNIGEAGTGQGNDSRTVYLTDRQDQNQDNGQSGSGSGNNSAGQAASSYNADTGNSAIASALQSMTSGNQGLVQGSGANATQGMNGSQVGQSIGHAIQNYQNRQSTNQLSNAFNSAQAGSGSTNTVGNYADSGGGGASDFASRFGGSGSVSSDSAATSGGGGGGGGGANWGAIGSALGSILSSFGSSQQGSGNWYRPIQANTPTVNYQPVSLSRSY